MSTGQRSRQLFGFRTLGVLGILAILCGVSPQYLRAQNSPLAVQSATGRVGIGTTTPTAPLSVVGAGVGTHPEIIIANNATDGINKEGVLAGGRKTNGHTPFTGIGLTDYGEGRRVDIGGDGYGLPDATSIAFWTSSTYTETINTGVERMRIDENGFVGIGTEYPSTVLHVNGDITASGAKNFQIDHPVEPEKKLLVHSALEGPEVAVYYRGEAELVNGAVEIALPSYFEALTRKEKRTVQLTAVKGWSPLYVADDIQDGRFTVRSAGGTGAQRFYWEVKAVRADVAPLVVEKEKIAERVSLTRNHSRAQ